MKSVILTGLSAMVGMVSAVPASPSGVLAPENGPPASCQSSFDGSFGLSIVALGKRSLDERAACNNPGALDLTLKDGVLLDSKGRTGSIVSNFQFQFDGPPQSGVIYTGGFSVCANGSLALGDSTVFYRCASGSFWNLYDRHWAEQCSPIHLSVLPCGGEAPTPTGGKVVGTTVVATTILTVIEDGQPQVVTTAVPIPLCQIDDGQVQGHTTPCGELPPVTQTAVQPPPSEPAYNPPGTPVAPSTATAVVTTSAQTTPRVSSPTANTTAALTTTAGGTPSSPGSTNPAAPPVSGGQYLAPRTVMALVASMVAAVFMF
ncbi:Cell wall mannoprotein CIS3 [Colletotrichum chlorophyti]|uniref:Cell wall mannoprotein CIS3 n=1 Tax=Colletotrichum chlorophyti TaxID=708187 RepID=A0A1Q8RRW8_9PEZI|nr:Cell wall mannoprotein CIS3 [Colletotrichum chlorophyti]